MTRKCERRERAERRRTQWSRGDDEAVNGAQDILPSKKEGRMERGHESLLGQLVETRVAARPDDKQTRPQLQSAGRQWERGGSHAAQAV